MPTIRPRGSRDETPAEDVEAGVGQQAAEVFPSKPVPELITMNAFGLLIEPTDEVGLFCREVLMKHFDFTVRLPRPELFTEAFDKAYEARRAEFPNFGAGSKLSTEEWWAPVFYKTFLDLGMPKEDVDSVFVGVFEELFYDSLTSEWAWEPVEDVLPMLDTLQEWRMHGGPKVGVVVDYDERLTTILENLDMMHYFDVVVSSREAGKGKPDPTPFKLAMEKAGVTDPSKVMHLGQDFDHDVVGAAAAGVDPVWVVMPSYDRLEPEQETLQLSFTKIGDLEAILSMYGRSDPERLISTTYKNKNRQGHLRVQY
jgi:putative hydrolase of the HAD superfamily